ncbi:hypothetical protein Hamer_G023438 [Homarus americanus]|uniref:Uncharacterized protein n=1 Tax=Homarus americanus TaxID=6706 RepID=A0A8J5MZZ3_HOMAM|nr:hypothetical protein Hamer_G023438 [Homarus americanus]
MEVPGGGGECQVEEEVPGGGGVPDLPDKVTCHLDKRSASQLLLPNPRGHGGEEDLEAQVIARGQSHLLANHRTTPTTTSMIRQVLANHRISPLPTTSVIRQVLANHRISPLPTTSVIRQLLMFSCHVAGVRAPDPQSFYPRQGTRKGCHAPGVGAGVEKSPGKGNTPHRKEVGHIL